MAGVLLAAQRGEAGRYYTDVAGVKGPVVAEAARLGCELTTYVPGHPMAGGHTSGPGAAQPSLFSGRRWVLCPTDVTRPEAVAAVAALVAALGALTIPMAATEHDRAVAVASHAPHVVASALASVFDSDLDPAVLAPAGRGVQDATRIAAGDVELWTDIASANARWIAAPVRAVAERLLAVAADLDRRAAHPRRRPGPGPSGPTWPTRPTCPTYSARGCEDTRACTGRSPGRTSAPSTTARQETSGRTPTGQPESPRPGRTT